MIIACAFKEVAILFFYDAGVQTTLGDYLVLDASSSVLLERIVITHLTSSSLRLVSRPRSVEFAVGTSLCFFH